MNRIAWVGGLVLVTIVIIAMVSALEMGEKSPIYAEGIIELSPELAADAQGINTLFIIINDAASPMPMPFGAVKERLAGDFTQPFSFTLTKEKMTMMNPDAPIPQTLRLKARLDKDGIAGVDQPGDLVGTVENVKVGSADVRLRIERKVP